MPHIVSGRQGQCRLAYVLPALPIGGAEKLLLSILRRLDRKWYDITVYSFTVKGAIGTEIEALDIPVIAFHNTPHWQDWRNVLDLVRSFRKTRPHIVHTHLFNANVSGRIAALICGVPVIVASVHGMYDWKTFLHRTLDNVLSRRTSGVIVVSNSLKEFLQAQENIPKEKVWVVADGVDPDEHMVRRGRDLVRADLDIVDQAPVIGTVGRLVRVKGIVYLLEGFARVLVEFPQAMLLVVGDGPLHGALERRCEELKIDSHVRFLGWRRDIPDLLNVMDVFCIPSLSEGFGISLVEAMVMGVATIASDVGGLREITDSGACGMLVEPANSTAIEHGILYFLAHPEERSELGRLGQIRALESYAISDTVQKLQDCYDKFMMIAEKRGPWVSRINV
jgi:glycosyltransferase involved in cell wall biosynthesis